MNEDKKQKLVHLEAMGFKTDANETGVALKQLEEIQRKTYDIKYAEFRGRDYVPINSSLNPASKFFTYYQWDMTGAAEFIANNAMDYPRVDAIKKEFTHKLKRLGDSYGYSKDDLLGAQVYGTQLDEGRARSARRGMESKIDDLIVRGDPDQGFKGFANHDSVGIIQAVAAAAGGNDPDWSAGDKVPLEILDDLHSLCNAIDNVEDGFFCDTILLDTPNFNLIRSTSMSVDNTESILSTFQKQRMGVSVAPWHQLRLEDAAGTGPRAIAYKRDPEVLEFYIAQEYMEEPAELSARVFKIHASSVVGGTVIRYPLAVAYMDAL